MFARAIRKGVGHDGGGLFPLMPYVNFREFSDEDIAPIVVYLRSLLPVHHELPKTENYLSGKVPDPQRAAASHRARFRNPCGSEFSEVCGTYGESRRIRRLPHAPRFRVTRSRIWD